MSLASANSATIKKAFARLALKEDTCVRNGMIELLQDAVPYALNAHDSEHPNHIMVGDSYGWRLVHNGIEVAMEIQDQNPYSNSAIMLRSIPVKSTGWVGVIMAGMQPASFYNVEYELGILETTKAWMQADFHKYFKKVNV